MAFDAGLSFRAWAHVRRLSVWPGVGRAQDAEGSIELVDPHVFRACADPRDLPFSNEAGEGFENKIAELFARKLGKSVAYTFYPDATGFIRNTLNAHRCDVVLGIAQGDDLVQPTSPYYRTSYVAAYRQDGPLKGLDSLSDPRLKTAKIGIVAGTPPATYPGRKRIARPDQILRAGRRYPIRFADPRDDGRPGARRDRRCVALGSDRRLLRDEGQDARPRSSRS